MRRWSTGSPHSKVVLGVALLVACSKPSSPPDPPWFHGDSLNPSGIRKVEIDHLGCPLGPCPVYRVSLSEDGRFEYEGRQFVRHVGLQVGRADTLDVNRVFVWLRDHLQLFSQSARLKEHGADLERLVYRFFPREGEVIVVETDADYGDFWMLSNTIDAIILRALIWDADEKQT